MREVLHLAGRGGTASNYAGVISRVRLSGLPVGTKYDSREFMEKVQHMGAICSMELLAHELAEVIPTIGIPSDLVLVWDGVTLGGGIFSRGETLCVICIGFSGKAGHVQHRLLATHCEALQKF